MFDVLNLQLFNSDYHLRADIMTLLRDTVTRLTHGRSSARCPPVAAGSAVCLSSWGRTSTWATVLGCQMTTELGCQGGSLSWLLPAPSFGDSALQSSELWRTANWEVMSGFGTTLFELLLMAESSRFLIGDCLWNESDSLGSLLFAWWQRKTSYMNPKWLTGDSSPQAEAHSLYDVNMFRVLFLMSENLKSVKIFPANNIVFLYHYYVKYLLGFD